MRKIKKVPRPNPTANEVDRVFRQLLTCPLTEGQLMARTGIDVDRVAVILERHLDVEHEPRGWRINSDRVFCLDELLDGTSCPVAENI